MHMPKQKRQVCKLQTCLWNWWVRQMLFLRFHSTTNNSLISTPIPGASIRQWTLTQTKELSAGNFFTPVCAPVQSVRILFCSANKNSRPKAAFLLVDLKGFEPSTPAMRMRCAPNCATSPYLWKIILPHNWLVKKKDPSGLPTDHIKITA